MLKDCNLKYAAFIFVLIFSATSLNIQLFSQTEINNGDIAIVGLNANNGPCGDTANCDVISIVFFKDITTGTVIDFTDNGWERLNPGYWGDTEGAIRATRTGTTIPAGTIITFHINPGYVAVVPDASWNFTTLGGLFNMNSGGDQIYFMQGGSWVDPVGTQNASYTGDILFGFNTRTVWAADGTTQQSNLYPGLDCFSMAPTGGTTNYIKYTGDTTGTDQKSWILRINNPANWSSYASCALYNSSGYDYMTNIKFRITAFFNVNAGNDSTVCASSSQFSLGGIPSGGVWSGTGVSSGQFDPSVSGPGTFTVTYTYDDAGCFYYDTKDITVNPSSTAAAAGTDQNVCGTAATLAGNTPAIGTGTWTLLSGTGTITNPSSPTSGITGLGTGANSFQWTITNSCTTTYDTVIINGVNVPTTALAGTDQSVCGTTATLAGNIPTTGAGTWTLISGSGTVTTPSSATSGITGLGTGANSFQWTITNSPCPSSSDIVIITGAAIPTVALAGTDQSVCGTTATLAGNVPSAGSGTWTLISGSGTVTTPSSATSGITGLGAGANSFQWTIANSPCPSSSDIVIITGVTPPTVSGAGTDQSVCGTTAILAGNVPSAGAGTWTLISGSGTITTPSSATSGITGLGTGANSFQWTISNSPCPSSTDQVTITGVDTPTVAEAGTDQSVCGTTATLAGNVPSVGAGTWTLLSGSGTVTTPSSATSGITGLGTGANVFQWTIANSPCPSSYDTVIITGVTPPTVANAGQDQTLCGSTFTLSGNVPSAGNGIWTLISGTGIITDSTSATSGITGLSVGVNVFEWTIDNPPCPLSFDQVSITITSTPTVASAGSDQSVCGTVAALSGNVPSDGTGTWTLISGSGIIDDPTSAVSGITGLGEGANVFQWTITSPPCTPSSDLVIITGASTPTTAAAGSDQSICGDVATLSGNAPSDGTGIWTLISGTGTITDSTDAASGITGLGIGVNVFQWTITNSPCPSSSDVVSITGVLPPTTASAGADQTLCGTSATLSGNTQAIGTGTWTLISGSGNITDPSLSTTGITGLASGENVFEWSISNLPCPSSSDQVSVFSESGTAQVTNQTNVLCFGDSTGSISVSMTGGVGPYNYIWQHDSTNNTNSSAYLAAGNYLVIITDSSGNCSDTLNINIMQPASSLNVIIVSQDISCHGVSDGILSANASGGTNPYMSYIWNTTPVQTTAIATGLVQGTYTVTVTDSNNCTFSTSDSISEPDVILISDSTVNPLCSEENTGSVYLTVTGGIQPYHYAWTGNVSTPDLLNAGAGIYVVTVTDDHNCTSTFISSLYDPADIIITDTTTISADNTGNIDITVTGGLLPYTFIWSNGVTSKDNTDLADGVYIVTVTDMNSCVSTDTISVNIPELPVVIPNVITPNGDNYNDDFEIKNIQYYSLVSVEIFNRWGDRIFVFEGTGPEYFTVSNRWNGTMNGKELPVGSYVYIIKIEGYDPFTGVCAIIR